MGALPLNSSDSNTIHLRQLVIILFYIQVRAEYEGMVNLSEVDGDPKVLRARYFTLLLTLSLSDESNYYLTSMYLSMENIEN